MWDEKWLYPRRKKTAINYEHNIQDLCSTIKGKSHQKQTGLMNWLRHRLNVE